MEPRQPGGSMPPSQPSTGRACGYAPKHRAAECPASQKAKKKPLKRAFLVTAGIVAAILAAVGGALAGLAVPGTPRSTPSLAFAGFIRLPRADNAGILSALDYLTVSDRTLFVASIRPGAVYRVPLGAGTLPRASDVTALEGVPSAHGVAFDPDSQLGFVSRSGTNAVDVFDPRTMEVLRRIPVDEDVDAILFDPSSKLIYAASGSPGLATLIDPLRQAKVGTLPLGGSPEFVVADPRTGLLYQNLIDMNAVALVDAARRLVVDRWPLTGCKAPTGIALDAARRRLFVACKGNSVLVVVSLDSHRVTGSIPVGSSPDSVAYDPGSKRIYTTGRWGVLSVIQQDGADAYRALEPVRLHLGAHTLAIDPVTHRVYAAYASLIGTPRLAVFDTRP